MSDLAGMETPIDLQALGRMFLAALVDRLGHLGAAGVLMLAAEELRLRARAESSKPDHRSSSSN
jgi:hypothetical protein